MWNAATLRTSCNTFYKQSRGPISVPVLYKDLFLGAVGVSSALCTLFCFPDA